MWDLLGVYTKRSQYIPEHYVLPIYTQNELDLVHCDIANAEEQGYVDF